MINRTISELQERTITINFTNGKANSLLKLGYIKIYLENDFNWLQKKMFKFLLGIEIEKEGVSDVED